ncbi:MAG: MBL fold metallo-hydrolase [Dehalococcoidia bacterium]|nr:MBL fold metallo-hydrolase [Dehalococcoidia bacterium]MDH4291278.1 MBL fold metallo-hydrolase [Dehalococcoidia bacterium]
MKIKWLGHACFLITSRDGLRVITDPYAVGGGINYSPIKETADVVLVSHDHDDHNNVSAVQGKPEVVKGSGTKTVKGIRFKGVATSHDASQGTQRGPNTVFCFTIDDLKLCHLGDLGHVLSPGQVAEIGAVDILFVPVGGFFTIEAIVANQVCDQLKPRTTIPMHFKTSKCAYPIASVDDFLKGKKDVRKVASSEAEFEPEKLSTATEIMLLQPAL